ncbi:MAG: SUMF1/EgtB/PvdO family nonheme iron enzyme, partial [Planctomycetota bacterium]
GLVMPNQVRDHLWVQPTNPGPIPFAQPRSRALPVATAIVALVLCAIALFLLWSRSGCSTPSASGANAIGSGAAKDDVDGLPSFLLPVPGGTVEMGLEVDAFVAACSQAVYPSNPKEAVRVAKDKLLLAMARTVSTIGRRSVTVEGFYLGKWPVKNSEYQLFVDHRRAAGQHVRPPYHWWRHGCKDDYERRRDGKAFPNDAYGPVLYWERHGAELPYKVQDEQGNSIADLPVVFVTWRDANQFAASLGMRLPTEAELTRAMRGDGKQVWPDKLLEARQMSKPGKHVLEPVGTVQAAVGPYGHVDLFGQVWQFCGDLGFGPMHGIDAFESAWKLLQKNEVGALLDQKSCWRPELAIAKGGSYLSYQEQIQLLIDARAPIQTVDALESLGMRLAKSLRPGYDYLYSLQRVEFSRQPFAQGQDLDLTGQVGAERYTVGDDGFSTDYEAVSFAPANWLVDEQLVRLADLLEGSQQKPLLVGALATTATFDNGAAPGLYAVLYRQAGIPRELSDAFRQGHEEVVKEQKAKANSGGEEPDKKSDEKPDKNDDKKIAHDWRTIVKRYGLTEHDLADAADGDCGFVRIDDVVVSSDRDAFLLSKHGAVVAMMPGTNEQPVVASPFAGTLVIEAGTETQRAARKANAVAKLRFCVPMLAVDPSKVVVFELHAVLEQEPPTEGKPWRLLKNE